MLSFCWINSILGYHNDFVVLICIKSCWIDANPFLFFESVWTPVLDMLLCVAYKRIRFIQTEIMKMRHLCTLWHSTSRLRLWDCKILLIYPNLERFVVYNHIDYHFRDLASLHLTLSNTNHLFRLILISVSFMHLTSFWATMINMPRRQDFFFWRYFPLLMTLTHG